MRLLPILSLLVYGTCNFGTYSGSPGSGSGGGYTGAGPDLSGLQRRPPSIAYSVPDAGLVPGFEECRGQTYVLGGTPPERMWALGSRVTVDVGRDAATASGFSVRSSDEAVLRVLGAVDGTRGRFELELVGAGHASVEFSSDDWNDTAWGFDVLEIERIEWTVMEFVGAERTDYPYGVPGDTREFNTGELSTEELVLLNGGIGVPVVTRLFADGQRLCGSPALMATAGEGGTVTLAGGWEAFANAVTMIDATTDATSAGTVTLHVSGAEVGVPLRTVAWDALDGIEVRELASGSVWWAIDLQPLAFVGERRVHGVPFDMPTRIWPSTEPERSSCPVITPKGEETGWRQRTFDVSWSRQGTCADVTSAEVSFAPTERADLAQDHWMYLPERT